MRENDKHYGFVMSLHEYLETVESLWSTTQKFLKEYPQYLHPNSSLAFITDDDASLGVQNVGYNLCHFWSNFEIGNLNWYRSDAYRKYFEYLDQAGGFFYERWGDAPVHSIAAALFLGKEQVHWFSDLGYFHVSSVQRCIHPAQY